MSILDDWCSPAAVDTFEKKLRAAGKTFRDPPLPGSPRLHELGAQGGLRRRRGYLAWERMLIFLGKHLR